MLDSEKLAIAAHLHVLLRRKVGRVTDVEWMVKNREYALEVVRVARAEPHPELTEWVDKLEAAVLGKAAPPQPKPSSATATALDALSAVLRGSASKAAGAAPVQPQHGELGFHDSTNGTRYVGRLR